MARFSSSGRVNLETVQSKCKWCMTKRPTPDNIRLQNPRKRKECMRLHATYSGAKYSRVEEGTSSTEEDDWLSSSEDEDDTFRATPPSVNLERRQETGYERTKEDLKNDEEAKACAIALAKIAWDTKAEEVTVLHVAPLVYWCSYMVLATIKSRPQMQAVVAKIEQKAEEEWNRPVSELARTSRGSEWEAIDLMDVVVHVFSAEQRDKYNLDEYYSQAEEVELPFLKGTDTGLGWSKTMQR